jgi:hypothetical protein
MKKKLENGKEKKTKPYLLPFQPSQACRPI